MAKAVNEDQDPAGTLPLGPVGLHLPQRYRDGEGRLVYRTRWETVEMTTWEDEDGVLPFIPQELPFRTEPTGYVHNEAIDPGQIALLLEGDEGPTLWDVKLVGRASCPECDWTGTAAEFREHYREHFNGEIPFDPSERMVLEAIQLVEEGDA